MTAPKRAATIAVALALLAVSLAGVWYFSRAKAGRYLPADLAGHYNRELHVGWLPDFHPQNNLAAMPRGRQEYRGVPFDARGVVQLQGREVLKRKGVFPAGATNIPVHQLCRKLHLLHGASWAETEGSTIASLVFHYQDGQEREIAVRYGEHVLDWWCDEPLDASGSNTRVAWSGENPVSKHSRKKLRIFQTRFENPLPSARVESVDYISSMSLCAPFLLALTVEQ